MTLFVGGPYHGRDFPIESTAKSLRLPDEEELDTYLGSAESDPGATGKHTWPFLYQLDESTDKPFYRYVIAD
jgi:hypothetical protein